MASFQQHHEQSNDLNSMKEKLTQEFKSSIEEAKLEIIEEVKHEMEEIKCSLVKEFQKVLNQLLQSPQLQRSALPSDASVLPSKAEPSASRSFRLDLKGEFPETLFTKSALEDEGFSLTLELYHDTGERACPESWMKDLKVEFAVIKGEFMVEERHDWTVEDYNNHVVTPRGGKPPLLDGNCKVSLSEGSARVCGMSITDNSKSIRNGYRLGAQVIGGLPSGWTVRPAVSKAFRVLEDRNKSDQKHRFPSPDDKLYRLKNISKTGPIYQRAKENNVKTVMDFLQLLYTDETELEEIFKIKGKKWDETVKNAEACILTDECYKFRYIDNTSGDALVLKCDFNIESVTFYGQASQPYESLDKPQKQKVDRLRKAAYKKREELIKEYEPIDRAQVQAGLEYPLIAEQPHENKQQPLLSAPPPQPSSSALPPLPFAPPPQPWSSALTPLPFAPPPSNIDPNVLDVPDQGQICSTSTKSYLRTTAADHDSYQHDFMNASSLFTGECEVHNNTDIGVGNSSSAAYEFPAEHVADNVLDSHQFLGETNMQQMFDDPPSNQTPSQIFLPDDIECEGFTVEELLNFTDGVQEKIREEIKEISRKWCLRLVPLVICRWKKRKAIPSRPQKKQKI